MPTTKLGKCTWGGAEAWAVLSAAYGPRPAEEWRAALAEDLRNLGYAPPPFLCSRASVGLRLALEEMRAQRPERSVVVVPAYCCPSVPTTVREAGLSLRAAAVGADLNLDLDRLKLGSDVLAVIGVHMYALPLHMPRLKSLADAAGAFVIDDAAHMVGRQPDWPTLGLAGDAGILSFNQSKTLTGGSPRGGGALFVTNDALRAGIARRFAALPELKARARTYVWFALRFAIETRPRALTEYIWDLDIPLIWMLAARDETPARMSAPAAAAVRAQLDRLGTILSARTTITAWYLNALQRHPNVAFVQATAPRYLSRMMVRWEGGPDALAVRERLVRKGFVTRLAYPQWTGDDDPTASFVRNICTTHLELPGSPRLTQREVDETVDELALCLKD